MDASIWSQAPTRHDEIFGVVIGIVAKVDGDPQKLDRVQIAFPTLQVASAWARVISFYAGADKGAFFAPAIDDEVLVAFERGDVSQPYVIGALWNGKDAPPVPAAKTKAVRQLQTASGAYLQFDDTEGAAKITITDKAGNAIVIDTKGNTISLTAKKDIVLSAEGRISINGAAVSIESSGSLDISCESTGKLAATGALTLSGASIALN